MTAIVGDGKRKHQGRYHLDGGLQVGRRLICPECGNDLIFFEVADNVRITTHYIQNEDGSFTPQSDDSSIQGEVKLYCGECQTDLSRFHGRFVEMLF